MDTLLAVLFLVYIAAPIAMLLSWGALVLCAAYPGALAFVAVAGLVILVSCLLEAH